jgi:hypothetical protein
MIPMTDDQCLGNALRRQRCAARISRHALAAASGLCYMCLTDIECGQRHIDAELYRHLLSTIKQLSIPPKRHKRVRTAPHQLCLL